MTYKVKITDDLSTGMPAGLVATSDGSGGVEWATVSASGGGGGGGGAPYLWHVDGALAAATQVGMTAIIPAGGEILKVILYVQTLGSAGTTTIDIHQNGTTIFTTQANRPSLAYDATVHVVEVTPEVTTLAAGDVLTLDIDEAATGAENLTVALAFTTSSSLPAALNILLNRSFK